MAEIALQTDFTLDDLLFSLGTQEQEGDDSFHTSKEWQKILGVSKTRVSKLLHLALEKGILLRDRQSRESVDGVTRRIQVYAFNIEKVSDDEA